MALTITEQPGDVAYTRNPMYFRIHNDNSTATELYAIVFQVDEFDAGNQIATLRKSFDLAGNALLRIEDVLDAFISFGLPDDGQWPTNMLRYDVAFVSAEPGQEPGIYEVISARKLALKGGFTALQYARGRRPLLNPANLTENLLTANTIRIVDVDMPVPVLFQAGADDITAVTAFYINTYTDGTTQGGPGTTEINFGDVDKRQNKMLQIGFDAQPYLALNPAKTLVKTILVFPYTFFELRLTKAKRRRPIYFVNKMGGIDSFLLTGQFSQKDTFDRSFYEVGNQFGPNELAASIVPANPNRTTIFEGNTGYHPKAEIEAAAYMLESPAMWEWDGDGYVPIVAQTGDATIKADSETAYWFDFSYQTALEEF